MNVVDTQLGLDLESIPPLAGYTPVQLATPELLNAFWPLAEPLLDRCVTEAMHGEYVTDDLRMMVEQGRAVLFVLTNDPTGTHPYRNVVLAWIVEPVKYPRLTAVNIVALGGSDFVEAQGMFWEAFKGYALMNGAQAIEANVNPVMARYLKRWGFDTVYTQVRCSLMEKAGD